MLRITVLNDDVQITRFKLEGKLAHEWVYEAQRTWKALPRSDVTETLIVDLVGVSFVDDSGRQLLAEMHREGAQLIGVGPLISSLIMEIEESEALREEA